MNLAPFKEGMGADSQLQKALDKLRNGGAKIGPPETFDGKTVFSVDGVLLTPEKIFTMAEITPDPKPKP